MTFNSFSISRKLRGLACLALTASLPCFPQSDALTVTPPAKLTLKRGSTATVKLQVQLKPDYHVNSNTPNEDYLIPLRLTWEAKPLELKTVNFPTPKNERFEFSEKPVSVYTNDFTIETKFDTPANAPVGMAIATGKLRYQACNVKMCLPPKTIPVQVPLEIR